MNPLSCQHAIAFETGCAVSPNNGGDRTLRSGRSHLLETVLHLDVAVKGRVNAAGELVGQPVLCFCKDRVSLMAGVSQIATRPVNRLLLMRSADREREGTLFSASTTDARRV